MKTDNIVQIIAKELAIKDSQVEKTIELIDDGNTIPFIARYRKEITGSLSDVQLRDLNDRLMYLRQLDTRREEIIRHITELDEMTEDIMQSILEADKLSVLEDIYRPYRPKRKTRASVAKQKGLEPLSTFMLLQENMDLVKEESEKFVDEEKSVNDSEEALAGAMDILAEFYSDRADIRAVLREYYEYNSVLNAELIDGMDEEGLYTIYHEFSEAVRSIPPHRVLAINRAEKEEILRVSLVIDYEYAYSMILDQTEIKLLNDYVQRAFEYGLKRLILPSIEREIRSSLTEKSEEHAISVFGINLKQKLMQAPLKDKVVLGYDPAYRTGCKLSVVDAMGKVLQYDTIYPTKPQSRIEQSEKIILEMIEKHSVDVIAIGNGTASRESESFVADTIKKSNRDVKYIIIDEAGASVYSASKLANSEYPDIDVSIRGAISIAARLQDPLSELVKIDPKSIGVGQYQHDVNQKRLNEVLDATIEDSVNSVGVDVNSASEALLSHIAGISAKTAKALVAHRFENGVFKNRKDIKKVKGIGPVSFQQSAGFLRISNGDNPYDSTGVHPEDYKTFKAILERLEISETEIGKANVDAHKKASEIGLDILSKELDIHTIKLDDLLKEIDKPARDPRESVPAPVLRSDVLTIEDLTNGMELKGTIRNIVDFGAFVDIGVKQDGLVHISKISNRYIKHPLDVVKIGDIVDVRVISVDLNRGKIGLSMVD